MGYFPAFGLIVFLLVRSISDVSCLSLRRDVEGHVRSSRTHTDEPPTTDWEIGLREATHQALLREGYANPNLRDYIQNAPFSRKHEAKVFGDIAVLARGQLYATPVGFSFVQDPYHNDCDECHNERKCRGDNCDHFVPYGAQQLVALWTVKRIRHRDINFGYRYEIEYTISPVDKALKEGFITRNGKFDYGIPGHVFVIKSNPRYIKYEHNEFYSSPDQVKWHGQYVPRPPEETYPRVLITHAHPPPLINTNSNQPPNDEQYQTNPHDKNLKEIQLYRNLLHSLSAKTSTTGHRFKIDPISTSPKTTINRIIPSATPTRTITPGKTTLVQLPTGQIVPATEVSTTPDGQFQILTPVGTPQNIDSTTSQVHLIPSSPITVTEVTKYHTEASIPNQIPSTKVPIFIMRELIPPSSPSYTPEVVKDMGSTKLPKKTTIHFFAAEDIDKPEQEEKDVNDIFKTSSKKYPTRKQFTESPQRTTKIYDEDDDNLNLFPAVKPTDAMRKVTEASIRKTLPSNNQISRPYDETRPTQSLTSFTTKEQSMFGRRTTIPFSHSTTTESSFNYGTQRTTITLPIPSTLGQQTTHETTYTFQPTQQYKGSQSSYNNNDENTPEPNETIVTVTPIPTAAVGHSTFDESTTTFYKYSPGRLTTFGNIEHTTEKREQSTNNDQSKFTLVFPSTPLDETTLPSKATDIGISREHIYYAGISTTEAYTESAPTTQNKFDTPSTNTIVTFYSPQTTENHDLAYPSTEPMTVQSTTSPSIKTTTAIFKSTKATRLATTKLKPSTTKSNDNDFLVEEISDEDDSVAISRNKSKFQDYTDDDIFGPAKPKQKEKKVSSYKRLPSKTYKTSFTTEPTRTVAKTPRIIYSDFYEASTVPPTTSLTQFYAESQNNYITKSLDVTTPHIPLTSQSYLTSISYKVNKKKTSTTGELEVLPTIRAKLSNLHNDEKLQIFRAELPDIEETATKKSSEKETFDNIALQLVNHARSLELLNRKPAMDNSNPVQEKKNLKYRRRSYMPKSRKNIKGKNKREKWNGSEGLILSK